MRVLILGSGGREHAIGWKISQSPECSGVLFAPGNAGTAQIGRNIDLPIEPVTQKVVDDLAYVCRHEDVELVIVGPEDPLSQGIVDRLRGTWDGMVFGPTAAGARLEADKAWAKKLMRSVSIPTAEYREFSSAEAALRYVEAHETPVVVKASGLAKGKGVSVCDDAEQAADAVRSIMIDREFGEAGDKIIVEERLVGQEVSILALVDGQNIYVLEPSQDHKQVGEGDTGPNTGGMGAYTPTPLVDDALMAKIEQEIVVPTVDVLRREGVTYQGVLYVGLMLTAGGPKVLEYNCRFGDPECQPLLMRMRGDLLKTILACCRGELDKVEFDWDPRWACCVVVCSGGYPGSYRKGLPISGLDEAAAMEDVGVFHAGTALRDDQAVTAGGRVINVVALGDSLTAARDRANQACELIRFDGAFYRHDIGDRVLRGRKAVSPKSG
jgi:phosphoribosylamine--glycine ligase